MTRLGATHIAQIKFLLGQEAEEDARRHAFKRLKLGEFATLCLTAARWADRAVQHVLDSEKYGRESVSLHQLDSLRASYVERFMHEIGALIEEANGG